jgi:LysR family cyn operon transcriptional activator
MRAQKISPPIVIEANTIGALIEVVRRSHLVTILPEAIGEQHTDLRNIAISPAPKPRTAAILRRRDAYQSAAALAFTRLCRLIIPDCTHGVMQSIVEDKGALHFRYVR